MALTGIIALIYASRQLSQSREAARVQHLLKFVEQFDSEPLKEVRESLANRRLEGIAEPPEMDVILSFFETIGLLVRRGHLDANDVWECFSYWIFNVYSDSREAVERGQKADASCYRDFSALVEKLRGIEEKEGGTCYPPSREDIKDFWKYELEIVAGKARGKRRKKRIPGEGGGTT
jgi:hypothetical protein